MKTNWQTKKLGEICDFQRGLTYSKNDEVGFSNNIVLRATNIDLNTNTLNFSELKYIDDSFKIPKDKKVSKGSLIICTASGSKSHLGKVALIDAEYDYAFGGFMAQITPKKEVDSKYLFYIFVSDAYKNLIDKLSSGININNLKFSDLENFEIKLPSLPEQKRIVKILDEAYEKIEKVKQNAEKNLSNSRDILKTHLNNVFLNNGKDWDEKTLADVCEVEYGYTEKAKAQGDYRFVRITDTDENGLLTQENKMYVASFKDAEKYLLTNGDLLMARTGASAGNVLFFESDERSVFASYLIRMKFGKDVLSKLYWHFSKSKLYWDQVKQLSAGSAQPQFNGGALKKIVLPFPKSLSEQKAIIKKLDQLSEQTKKLESIYQKKLSAIEELKKSILSKAFSKGL